MSHVLVRAQDGIYEACFEALTKSRSIISSPFLRFLMLQSLQLRDGLSAFLTDQILGQALQGR